MIDFSNTTLGIEFGSTRVKAVLIGLDFRVLAEGVYDWENSFENGYWTYAQSEMIEALQQSFAALKAEVKAKYGETLTRVGAIGISGMMHGYLPLNKRGELLVPFRTWRNTTTSESAKALTKLFSFNIPERWSIAHLYQAMLNGEPHVKDIFALTTLAGYIHEKLTGEYCVGVGEAAGMFPIDETTNDYNETMLRQFEALPEKNGCDWALRDILPAVRLAGYPAGWLTPAGAVLLDVDGDLMPGIPFCPPEGDAGTGMVATNSVRPRTGNVSAGTSVFAMVVLEHALKKVYPEIDMVTTPEGAPVAMVHCNNCTADIDAWAQLLFEMQQKNAPALKKGDVFDQIYQTALKGEPDCGGLLSFNYLSGESITNVQNGVPLFLRPRDSRLTFPNFARNLLYSALATLRIGMELLEEEQVDIDFLYGHGGFFKTKYAGQSVMASALDIPVTVMETADVGGPWGMALLAMFLLKKEGGQSLAGFLQSRVFRNSSGATAYPHPENVKGFAAYLEQYKRALPLEQQAQTLFYS